MPLCECGCGQETNVYRGKSRRFILGHNQRGAKASDETKLKMSRPRKPFTESRIITQDLLKELFDYREDNLYWKVRKGPTARMSYLAGRVRKDGYRGIRIDDKLYYAHRLIFLYHYGYLPQFLDHADGDPTNNNINNIREATRQENNRNKKKIESINGKPTSSEFKGIWWNKQREKWQVQIKIGDKRKSLGSFESEIDAARAYNAAAIKYFGEFAYLNTISTPKPL